MSAIGRFVWESIRFTSPRRTLSIDLRSDVQDLPYAPLDAQLVRDGQVIRLSEPR